MKTAAQINGPQVGAVELDALHARIDQLRQDKRDLLKRCAMLRIRVENVEKERDEALTQLRAWQEAFGTNQLTHAIARLEAAEKQSTHPEPRNFDGALIEVKP